MADGQQATFHVDATGENLCYQWQYWNGTGWANADGWVSDTATLSFQSWAGGSGLWFRCVIWNAQNGSDWAETDYVNLTVS